MLDWLNERDVLRQATHSLVANASRLDIAVAFWGNGPLERLPLSAQRTPPTRIIANVMSGGTNPAAVRELLREFGSDRVRQLNDLHAKVFLSDTHLILGSANVSTNGLGLEGNEQIGWREACIRTNDPATLGSARTWFDAQWNASAPIHEADLAQAEEAWRRARQRRPMAPPSSTAGKDGLLAYELEALQGRGLFIAITSDDLSRHAKKTLAGLQKEDPTVDGYEDWSSIPLNAVLLAFGLDVFKNGNFKTWWNGAWETPADKKARKANTFDGVTLVRPPRREWVLPISKPKQSAWVRDVTLLCQAFRDNPKLLPKGHTWNDWCLPIEAAWAHLNELVPPKGLPEDSLDPGPNEYGQGGERKQRLATVTDEALRTAIREVAAGRRTFHTTDLIRHIAKHYIRDRKTPVADSPNAEFARRLSKDRKKLGIRLVASNVDVRDDEYGRSQTARWELFDAVD